MGHPWRVPFVNMGGTCERQKQVLPFATDDEAFER